MRIHLSAEYTFAVFMLKRETSIEDLFIFAERLTFLQVMV